jgi:hypothetical protein
MLLPSLLLPTLRFPLRVSSFLCAIALSVLVGVSGLFGLF